jgi:hypothetical protein
MTKLIDYETHTGHFLEIRGVGEAYLRHNQSFAEGKLQQENLAEGKALTASFHENARIR